MKTILHPDYWVEIPAGEYRTGFSTEQRESIKHCARMMAGYYNLSPETQALIERAAEKFRHHAEYFATGEFHSVKLDAEEKEIVTAPHFHAIMKTEEASVLIPITRLVWLDRFYILRFPVTSNQYGLFRLGRPDGIPASNLPGILEESSHYREVGAIDPKIAKRFCRELKGRLPTYQEWEKAARGIDGYLYPWGNVWDLEAGDFYYGQFNKYGRRVDAYPRGISPYGVWFMAGGLPELTKDVERVGTHARESSAEMAWLDHIIGLGKGGDWISFRPVLTNWPQQHLTGFQAGLSVPNAAALQKMGPLADLLLTQYNWPALETKLLDTLEPAIVAVREARKDEAQELLAEILHNDDTLEAAWLLQAAVLADVPRQRESVQRALALNPQSEVWPKLAALLKEPPRVAW